MKLSRLVDPNVQACMRKLLELQLPLPASFKLKKLMKAADEELNRYDETRKEALNRLGKKKEGGSLELNEKGEVQFEPESLQNFAKELNELLQVEVTIGTLSVRELGNINISTADLLSLDGIIVE